ncbi:hypothetical protein MAP00_002921 [Monascus purpureus]|nr:hypothetical protein MAP00_002921 [Monascus purpureus]
MEILAVSTDRIEPQLMLLSKQVHFHIVQRALAMNNRLYSRICLPTSGETVALSGQKGPMDQFSGMRQSKPLTMSSVEIRTSFFFHASSPVYAIRMALLHLVQLP